MIGFSDTAELVKSIFSFQNFLRTAYSVVLISISFFLAKEAVSVWITKTISFDNTKYFKDGADSTASATAVNQLITFHYGRFLAALAGSRLDQAESKGTDLTAAWLPQGLSPFVDARTAFSDIELNIQGINVQKILSVLRNTIARSDNVDIALFRSGDKVSTIIKMADDSRFLRHETRFSARTELGPFAGDQDAASAVACFLIWLQSFKGQEDFRYHPREEFCRWLDAYFFVETLQSWEATAKDLDKTERERLEGLREIIAGAMSVEHRYLDLYRLSANLIDFFGRDSIAFKDKAVKSAIASSILRYIYARARVDQDFLADAHEKMAAAIASEDFLSARSLAIHFFKRNLVCPAADPISEQPDDVILFSPFLARSDRAVVKILEQQGEQRNLVQTGFLVDESYVMGVDFGGLLAKRLRESRKVYARFEREEPPETVDIEIAEVVGLEQTASAHAPELAEIALFKLAKKVADVEPLAISSERADFTARDIVVLGFPAQDARINVDVFAALVGGNAGRYHRMFGKVLKAETIPAGTLLTYDAFTAAGVSGGPVIDLRSGQVIAIHRAGRILGEIAKLGQGVSLEKFVENAQMRKLLAKSLQAKPPPPGGLE